MIVRQRYGCGSVVEHDVSSHGCEPSASSGTLLDASTYLHELLVHVLNLPRALASVASEDSTADLWSRTMQDSFTGRWSSLVCPSSQLQCCCINERNHRTAEIASNRVRLDCYAFALEHRLAQLAWVKSLE